MSILQIDKIFKYLTENKNLGRIFVSMIKKIPVRVNWNQDVVDVLKNVNHVS